MTPRERRAYAAGYRLALRRTRKELNEMRERLDDELAGLDDRMRAAHQQTVRNIGDELVELMGEMEGMKSEYRRWKAIEEALVRDQFYRLKAVEEAIATERDPNELLN